MHLERESDHSSPPPLPLCDGGISRRERESDCWPALLPSVQKRRPMRQGTRLLAAWLLLLAATLAAAAPPLTKTTRSLTVFSSINQRPGWAMGSSPPSCRRKCGGCVPCAAVQVPTRAGPAHLEYANYEPEGWKCQCGSSFYNP